MKERNIKNVNACDYKGNVVFYLYYSIFSVAKVEIRDFII